MLKHFPSSGELKRRCRESQKLILLHMKFQAEKRTVNECLFTESTQREPKREERN